ncbi:MAG TPA: hypothetical protein VGF86_09300 [Candidatus Tumulicola sp.]|jgi:hypothetical protein
MEDVRPAAAVVVDIMVAAAAVAVVIMLAVAVAAPADRRSSNRVRRVFDGTEAGKMIRALVT